VSLLPAYPNPFNPITTIRYQIPEQTIVSIIVVNMLGQEVASLVNSLQQPGDYSISWDASDYASGIYFIQLTTETQTSLQKLMLIK
ncbi:MAG: T9SS type A sorting domain-containing protein, partial [Fidelibacterota bacterium]